VNLEKEGTFKRYGQSKLANVLHAQALAKRYQDKGILSVSCHPGNVDTEFSNEFQKNHPIASTLAAPLLWLLLAVYLMTPEQGATTSLFLASSDKVTFKDNGKYYIPYGVQKEPGKWARVADLPDKLWDWTEEELKKRNYEF